MSKPFPTLHGGCCCGSLRYKLLSAPLFCHACHCNECQKQTGSVCSLAATIEGDRISYISETQPMVKDATTFKRAMCPQCWSTIWTSGTWTPGLLALQIGTLDLPSLMEPDMHEFIEGKIEWIGLPEGARTCKGDFDKRKYWPKQSLERYVAYMKRMNVKDSGAEGGLHGLKAEREVDGEAEKTPTNGSPEPRRKEEDVEEEDDAEIEDLEKKYDEIERSLQERLERLTLKLEEEAKGKGDEPKTESHPAASTETAK
jgi:hypothetical protein